MVIVMFPAGKADPAGLAAMLLPTPKAAGSTAAKHTAIHTRSDLRTILTPKGLW